MLDNNFTFETETDHDGYQKYKRRQPHDRGYIVTVKVNNKEITLDNRREVSNSPLLPKVFNSHIHLE